MCHLAAPSGFCSSDQCGAAVIGVVKRNASRCEKASKELSDKICLPDETKIELFGLTS